MRPWVTIEKNVGETPLASLARVQKALGLPPSVPLAYAGRLDPMASGKLLVLIGDECIKQQEYHHLDKKYRCEILFSVGTDTGDVLGLVTSSKGVSITKDALRKTLQDLRGNIVLPYPHFSSKTVRGKPLHTWTLEGRIGEIEIPTKQSTIYTLTLVDLRTVSKDTVYKTITEKIETIPPVTDPQKALGADFRRVDIRARWERWYRETSQSEFQVATILCTVSSGTYMRTLAGVIGDRIRTDALAYSIHRSVIGTYRTLFGNFGIWSKRY